MAVLPENDEWVAGIYQLEETDPVQGGADGVDNRQARELAARTLYLKNRMEENYEAGGFMQWDKRRSYKKGEKVSVLVGDDVIDYWCNKANVDTNPIDDSSDVWRKYPYESLVNQGVNIELWYTGLTILTGGFSFTSARQSLGSAGLIYDGSYGAILPTKLKRVLAALASQSDSSSVGVETATMFSNGQSMVIRAGGISPGTSSPASYEAVGTYMIIGYK